MLRPGSRNLITDVDGILVGNEENQRLRSGVSVVLCERPSVASVDVRGGAPGTRDTDLLEVAEHCQEEASGQLSWLRTRMKQAAPQALVVAD